MQYLVCCDYFRTPVIFRVTDIFVFVGGIAGLISGAIATVSYIDHRSGISSLYQLQQ